MLSSVRRGGLGPVRDAVAPVLKILRYEPLRFEDVTNQPVPPRTSAVELPLKAAIFTFRSPPRCGLRRCDAGHRLRAESRRSEHRAERGLVVVAPPVGGDARTPPGRVHRHRRVVRHWRLSRNVHRHGRLPRVCFPPRRCPARATIQSMRSRTHEKVALPWRADDRTFPGGVVLLRRGGGRPDWPDRSAFCDARCRNCRGRGSRWRA